MKTKIMGILIFLFFVICPYVLESGNLLIFFAPAPVMIVFGTSIGLTLASYRKGMNKQTILKRAKKYLIFTGYFGTLCGIIGVFGSMTHTMLTEKPELLFIKLSYTLTAIFLGYLAAYIVDTFIQE